jgi:hypothetical protein
LVTQNGVATDQSNVGPFLPVPGRLDISPHIRKLFVQLGVAIGRTRFMMIKPGEEVKNHFDRTNHVDQAGNPDVNSGYCTCFYRFLVALYLTCGVSFDPMQFRANLEVHRSTFLDAR